MGISRSKLRSSSMWLLVSHRQCLHQSLKIFKNNSNYCTKSLDYAISILEKFQQDSCMWKFNIKVRWHHSRVIFWLKIQFNKIVTTSRDGANIVSKITMIILMMSWGLWHQFLLSTFSRSCWKCTFFTTIHYLLNWECVLILA